jgi:hypothetical protein
MHSTTTKSLEGLIKEGQPCVFAIEQSGMSDFGTAELGTSHQIIVLSPEHRMQIEDVDYDCSTKVSPKEPTLVRSRYVLASLFARVDCSITEDGVAVYESEERPAGIGITDRLIKRANGIGIHGASNAINGPIVLE